MCDVANAIGSISILCDVRFQYVSIQITVASCEQFEFFLNATVFLMGCVKVNDTVHMV